MRNTLRLVVTLCFLAFASSAMTAERITILDYCDPADPAWAPTGGCFLKDGDVTLEEFNLLLNSVLSEAVVGHPAWRFEPSFVETKAGDALRVVNGGGRAHTFTEVADFGGGFVAELNKGLTPAPECASATVIPAGATANIRGLASGDHLFQCCIHPWMRALVNVEDR